MKATHALLRAAELIGGDRAQEHGDMAVTMRKTADLWSVYLETPVSPEQVCQCMALLKMVRSDKGSKGDDSYIDQAGYSAMAGQLR